MAGFLYNISKYCTHSAGLKNSRKFFENSQNFKQNLIYYKNWARDYSHSELLKIVLKICDDVD